MIDQLTFTPSFLFLRSPHAAKFGFVFILVRVASILAVAASVPKRMGNWAIGPGLVERAACT